MFWHVLDEHCKIGEINWKWSRYVKFYTRHRCFRRGKTFYTWNFMWLILGYFLYFSTGNSSGGWKERSCEILYVASIHVTRPRLSFLFPASIDPQYILPRMCSPISVLQCILLQHRCLTFFMGKTSISVISGVFFLCPDTLWGTLVRRE